MEEISMDAADEDVAMASDGQEPETSFGDIQDLDNFVVLDEEIDSVSIDQDHQDGSGGPSTSGTVSTGLDGQKVSPEPSDLDESKSRCPRFPAGYRRLCVKLAKLTELELKLAKHAKFCKFLAKSPRVHLERLPAEILAGAKWPLISDKVEKSGTSQESSTTGAFGQAPVEGAALQEEPTPEMPLIKRILQKRKKVKKTNPENAPFLDIPGLPPANALWNFKIKKKANVPETTGQSESKPSEGKLDSLPGSLDSAKKATPTSSFSVEYSSPLVRVEAELAARRSAQEKEERRPFVRGRFNRLFFGGGQRDLFSNDQEVNKGSTPCIVGPSSSRRCPLLGNQPEGLQVGEPSVSGRSDERFPRRRTPPGSPRSPSDNGFEEHSDSDCERKKEKRVLPTSRRRSRSRSSNIVRRSNVSRSLGRRLVGSRIRKYEEKRRSRSRSRSHSRGRGHDRGRSRSRSCSRLRRSRRRHYQSRSKSHSRRRSRSRSLSRSRSRRRSHSGGHSRRKTHSRTQSSDQSRSHSRTKSRSKSHSRPRSHSRSRGKRRRSPSEKEKPEAPERQHQKVQSSDSASESSISIDKAEAEKPVSVDKHEPTPENPAAPTAVAAATSDGANNNELAFAILYLLHNLEQQANGSVQNLSTNIQPVDPVSSTIPVPVDSGTSTNSAPVDAGKIPNVAAPIPSRVREGDQISVESISELRLVLETLVGEATNLHITETQLQRALALLPLLVEMETLVRSQPGSVSADLLTPIMNFVCDILELNPQINFS